LRRKVCALGRGGCIAVRSAAGVTARRGSVRDGRQRDDLTDGAGQVPRTDGGQDGHGCRGRCLRGGDRYVAQPQRIKPELGGKVGYDLCRKNSDVGRLGALEWGSVGVSTV